MQAGGAEAVDGHRGDSDWQPGAQRGDARYVHALLGFGSGAADDDVFDFGWVEAFGAGDGFFDGGGGEIVGASGAQGAFAGFADGGAHGTNDDGFTHGCCTSGDASSLLMNSLYWMQQWRKSNRRDFEASSTNTDEGKAERKGKQRGWREGASTIVERSFVAALLGMTGAPVPGKATNPHGG